MKHLFIGILTALAYALLISSCKNQDVSDSLFVKSKVQKFTKGVGNTSIDLSQKYLDSLISKKPEYIVLDIPFQDTMLKLALRRLDVYDDGFKLVTSGINTTQNIVKLLSYSGKVVNDINSFVSLTVNGDNVDGIISSQTLGMLTISKVAKTSYLLYNSENDKIDTMKFNCLTKDTLVEVKKIKGPYVERLITGKCITMNYEVSYNDFVRLGSVQAVVNWISSMFAVMKVLYANEGIEFKLGMVYVWQTPDGYNPDIRAALDEFGSRRANDPNFNGTFSQLVIGKSGGALGGIAWVGGLCNKNYRFSVVQPTYTFNPNPSTYSWSITVFTHEVGHNLGSPHTHSCTWPGGAIDNCYPTEGGCAAGPAPVGGGTLMSYCHMTQYGINYANGFGPKPRALILNNVSNALCISCVIIPPVPVANCNDGIKNQNEIGIDCGGICPPCVVIPPATDEVLISLGKPISMSTKYNPLPNSNPNYYSADKANDGNTGTFCHTTDELTPWIEIDLGLIQDISKIDVVNRKDCGQCVVYERLKHFKILVDGVMQFENFNVVSDGQTISLKKAIKGRYVRLQAIYDSKNYLHIAELSVFKGTPVIPPPPGPCIPHDTVYQVIHYKLVPFPVDSPGKSKCN